MYPACQTMLSKLAYKPPLSTGTHASYPPYIWASVSTLVMCSHISDAVASGAYPRGPLASCNRSRAWVMVHCGTSSLSILQHLVSSALTLPTHPLSPFGPAGSLLPGSSTGSMLVASQAGSEVRQRSFGMLVDISAAVSKAAVTRLT